MANDRPVRPLFVVRMIVGCGLLLLTLTSVPVLTAEESAAKSVADGGSSKASPRERKKSAARLMMYVVWGIAGIGVVLIAGVLLWGAKIRRGIRREKTPPEPHDPLWYLKAERRKQEAAKNEPKEAASDTD